MDPVVSELTVRLSQSHVMFRLHDVCVAHGPCHVLETGELTLESRSAVGLMGPNGSGKTTLLRVLSGVQKPTSGTVEKDPGLAVGFVIQGHVPHEYMPMRSVDVIRVGRYRRTGLLGRMRSQDRSAISNAAERLGVSRLMNAQFATLSGGQRQRVLVAMALAAEPDCLLLDEPVTGLDIPSQKVILDVIQDERDKGRLVVMSTHHPQEARCCDRVILLKGAVLADGLPDEVLKSDMFEKELGAVASGPAGRQFILRSPYHDSPADHSGHHHDHDHHLVRRSLNNRSGAP